MADPNGAKPRRIWRIVLVVSLAMNLAVVGIVAGFGLRDKDGGGPRGFDVALGPIGRALAPDDRRAIADALRSDPNLTRVGQDERRDQMDAFVQLLQADTFDADAVAVVLDTATSRMSHVQQAAQAALIARIAQMSDAERDAFAARVAELRPDRRKR